jgi:hypothetical protein
MDLVALVLFAGCGVIGLGCAHALVRVARRSPAGDRSLAEDADASRLGELAERKEMVMQLILSTQLDLATGKISEEDHAKTYLSLRNDAGRIVKEMEALGGTEEDLAEVDADLEAHLEALRSDGANREWSAAARLRHGGQAPGTSV